MTMKRKRNLRRSSWCTLILRHTNKRSWRIRLLRMLQKLLDSKTQIKWGNITRRKLAKMQKSCWRSQNHFITSADKKKKRKPSSMQSWQGWKTRSTSSSKLKLKKLERQRIWLSYGKLKGNKTKLLRRLLNYASSQTLIGLKFKQKSSQPSGPRNRTHFFKWRNSSMRWARLALKWCTGLTWSGSRHITSLKQQIAKPIIPSIKTRSGKRHTKTTPTTRTSGLIRIGTLDGAKLSKLTIRLTKK